MRVLSHCEFYCAVKMLKHYLMLFVILVLIQQDWVKSAARGLLFQNKTSLEYSLGETIVLSMLVVVGIFLMDQLIINEVF